MRANIVLLSMLAAVPGVGGAASAHATYFTDDDAFQITIGNLGEPVYTYQKTGLDLIIRQNTTERKEVPGVNSTLEATLLAPGGEELAKDLQLQHGAVGRYTFTDGYTLTQPGLYKVRLVGSINGTPVDGVYNMPHEIRSQGDIMFPDAGLPTLQELHDENEALSARIGGLESKIAGLESKIASHDAMIAGMEHGDGDHEATKASESPGFAGFAALAAIGIAVALRRRG